MRRLLPLLLLLAPAALAGELAQRNGFQGIRYLEDSSVAGLVGPQNSLAFSMVNARSWRKMQESGQQQAAESAQERQQRLRQAADAL